MRLMQDMWEPVLARMCPEQDTWELVLERMRLEQDTWELRPVGTWRGAH